MVLLKKGAKAGFDYNGYWGIGVDGKIYLAHRLAFLYMTSEWPPGDIDHRDCDKANNLWSNLRPATRSQNKANTKAPSDNKSRIKGVSWLKRSQKWRVDCMKDGKSYSLGLFTDKLAAAAAYQAFASEAFGEFARVA